MNLCVETHSPKFEITYKSAKGGKHTPVWLVCDSCMKHIKCFGSDDEIESIKALA